MASLKFLLGMLPETAVMEEKETQLRKDYEAYKAFEVSDELRQYELLRDEVTSDAFRQKVKEIKSQNYKSTPEYTTEMEFLKLKKSGPIRNYFKVLNSDKLREYGSFSKSPELKRYTELKEYVLSDAFIKEKSSISSKEYKNSEPGLREKEYKQASSSAAIKGYFKFEKSREYAEYKRIEGSDELKRYYELEKLTAGDKFLKVKNFMNLSAKEKYESSPEYTKAQSFEQLSKSEKVVWYYKTKKKYPFSYIEKWELKFNDEFEGPKLDSGKWICRYSQGDKSINKLYVLGDDRHAFTEGKNIEFFDKKLRILTKREKGKSLVWNPLLGFYEKDFEFTSDLINTADKFNQKYGLFEAKVKIAPSSVSQSLSLKASGMLPHIDIFKFEKSKVQAGLFWKSGSNDGIEKSISKASSSKFTKGFFIYSIEWLPGRITWKINGEVFKVQLQGVPDESLSVMFNSSLKEKAGEEGIPSAMEVDWIRVYKIKEG